MDDLQELTNYMKEWFDKHKLTPLEKFEEFLDFVIIGFCVFASLFLLGVLF